MSDKFGDAVYRAGLRQAIDARARLSPMSASHDLSEVRQLGTFDELLARQQAICAQLRETYDLLERLLNDLVMALEATRREFLEVQQRREGGQN